VGNPIVAERIAGDSIGLGESGTAGPSTTLRAGRDDKGGVALPWETR
jgi:hypothetical protein